MRRALIGVALALAFAGVAQASDFIVVNSTDPGIKRGDALDAGARVALGAGKTLTLMRPSGEVTTVRGTAGGAILPGARLAQNDGGRMDSLKALLAPPPEGRTFGARRGGFCPPVESLTTLDDILRVANTSGCKTEARAALDAYVSKSDTPIN